MVGTFKTLIASYKEKPLWQRRAIYGFVGAIGGFAYYYFIGCAHGSCLITGNPYVSTAYGTLMGMLVPVQKKRSKKLSMDESR